MNDLINKITYGDAYALIKKIPDKSIDMIYTDVPYFHTSGGKGKSKISAQSTRKNGELKFISSGFELTILDEFVRVSKRLNCFIWCSRLQVPELLNYFTSYGFLFDILVWTKTNPIPTANNNFLSDVEYCLYFRDHGVCLNDGHKLKSKWFSSPINKRDKDLYDHPTIKPIALVTRHIQHASQIGDIILDPFVGSGTTALAALNSNRRYIAFENCKKWYDTAVNRMNGIQANGQTMFFPQ